MDFIVSLTSSLSKTHRAALVYAGVFSLVVYVSLMLIFSDFRSLYWVQQVLFSAGVSIIWGVMMLVYYPFICKKVYDPFPLLFIWAVLIVVIALVLCCVVGISLVLFPFFYLVGLVAVMVVNWKMEDVR